MKIALEYTVQKVVLSDDIDKNTTQCLVVTFLIEAMHYSKSLPLLVALPSEQIHVSVSPEPLIMSIG
jgi:isochorismate synthase EntC